MKYIVDTSVWSEALRRSPRRETEGVKKLETLISGGERILLPAIILQEILQGIKNPQQFAQLKDSMRFFPTLDVLRDDHVFAAELFNLCRSKGVQASTVDFLIAALSIHNDCALLTSDGDFKLISKHCELKLL